MALHRRIRDLKKRALLKLKRRLSEEILVLGDSHASIFHDPQLACRFQKSFFHVFNIGGATASGLANPNSVTRAYQTFRAALDDTTARQIIVMLGEVDTGFVIWYRAQKYNESVASVTDKAILTYTGFLLEIQARPARVICVSTPLPTIRDGNDWGEIANARKEVNTTQAERTRLTLHFNQQVAAFCREHDITFIDLDPESLGADGTVKSELLNPDPNDHHYAPDAYIRMLVEPLKQALEPLPAGFAHGK